jgi:hypothetical protein
MSSNAIVPVAGRPPALFANRKSSLNAAAMAGVQASFAVIGYKGRNWRIKYRGEENMVTDARGAPVPSLDVIIVGIAQVVAKQWYEKKYTEGDDDSPDCFSVDGIAPDPTSTKLQCSTCAVCPRAQWGSRITEDGRKGKACQDNRRIAVVPLGDPKNESYGGPMMLRIPPMSLNQLANYAQMLERKGASMEFVATRLGFNYDVSYPLITFEASSWLSDEQAELVVGADGNGGISGSEQVARILGMVDSSAPQPAPAAEIPGTPPNVVQMPRQVTAHNPVLNAPYQAQAAQTSSRPAPTPDQYAHRLRFASVQEFEDAFGVSGPPSDQATAAQKQQYEEATQAPQPTPAAVQQADEEKGAPFMIGGALIGGVPHPGMPAPATPRKANPFMTGATPAMEQPNGHANGAAAFQAPQQTQAPAAPPTPAAQAAPAPVAAVQPAPIDMQSAIDELLNAPV